MLVIRKKTVNVVVPYMVGHTPFCLSFQLYILFLQLPVNEVVEDGRGFQPERPSKFL